MTSTRSNITAQSGRKSDLAPASSRHVLRWGLKKAARRGVALASWMAGLARDTDAEVGEGSIRVLTYHRFGDAKYDPFCVSPADFEAQVAFLSSRKLAISLSQFQRFIEDGARPVRNAVLVTIDDGYLSTWSIALPILKKYRVPAVAFVTPSLVGKRESCEQAISEGYAGWAELAELVAAGIDVASHSLSHRSLGRMPAREAQEEATASKKSLEDHLGIPVTAFAYPYGTLADFNVMTSQILREAGYQLAFTSQHGSASGAANPLELPRIKIEGGEPLWMFRLSARGALDRWSWVDRTFWRLQASPGHNTPEQAAQADRLPVASRDARSHANVPILPEASRLADDALTTASDPHCQTGNAATGARASASLESE